VACLVGSVGLFLTFGPSLWRKDSPGEVSARQALTAEVEVPAPAEGARQPQPAEQTSPTPAEQTAPAGQSAPTEQTPPTPAEQAASGGQAAPASQVEVPVQTRERGIFFVRARDEGEELDLIKVNRNIRVSQSPLRDSLDALLSGPTAEEAGQGFISLIAPEVRLIGVAIRDETAFINFNDSFQYNPWGNEGLAYQIRQIVWTATEFANVQVVQILIEGKIVDFLNGGIRIGSPLYR